MLARLPAFFELDFGAKTLECGVLEEGKFDAFGEFFWNGFSVVLAELRFVVLNLHEFLTRN